MNSYLDKNNEPRINLSRRLDVSLAFLLLFFIGTLCLVYLSSAVPSGLDQIVQQINETKLATNGTILNTSGGYISTINITATSQNLKWKAFVGAVTGQFTLDDASGSTIYDWSITTVGGEVYATRNSSTILWTNINCSNVTLLEIENRLMNHSNPSDNITKTFNDTTHVAFTVGSRGIPANACPTTNTYVNSASQQARFEEIALTDTVDYSLGHNIIYTTLIETDQTGFDGGTYDFQMIVPENGLATWTGATAYYLYVELS